MNRPSASLPLLLAVIAALVVAYFINASRHRSSPAAQAMLSGKARGAADVAQASDDQSLQDDEEAAGALWAKAHRGKACPTDPVAFAKGCAK